MLADVPVPSLDLLGNPVHLSAHDAIVQNVRDLLDIKLKLATASGRAVTLLQRRLKAAEAALKQRFDALWGFAGQVDLIQLPGE